MKRTFDIKVFSILEVTYSHRILGGDWSLKFLNDPRYRALRAVLMNNIAVEEYNAVEDCIYSSTRALYKSTIEYINTFTPLSSAFFLPRGETFKSRWCS